MDKIKEKLKELYGKAEDKIGFINDLREFIHNELSDINQPIDMVTWVPIDKIKPNDYNPNAVAKIEMSLLYKSIKHYGYTQPIVTVYDKENDEYVIVDGFHRYFVAKSQEDILKQNKGMLPITIIKKDINERMAATIRHNRARGEHSVSGMSNMVFKMLDNVWKDEEICNQLGMEPEEILKLKHITGFAKLFENAEYKKAWETKRQIVIRQNKEEWAKEPMVRINAN